MEVNLEYSIARMEVEEKRWYYSIYSVHSVHSILFSVLFCSFNSVLLWFVALLYCYSIGV